MDWSERSSAAESSTDLAADLDWSVGALHATSQGGMGGAIQRSVRALSVGAVHAGVVVALAASISACTDIRTQTPFAQAAGDAAATLAAVQATLEAEHAGRLTAEYARATFV